jgi:hypothetical protein
MRGANITQERQGANGSWNHPVYPKTGAVKTIKHVVTTDSVVLWAILSLLAFGLVVAARHSDFVHNQVTSIKARLHASEADRREIHREIRAIEP